MAALRMYAIPENYTGTLTIGTTEDFFSQQKVDFIKAGGSAGIYGNDGTTSGTGVLSVVVDDALSEFFSSKYDYITIKARDSGGRALPFIYDSVSYDCIELPFLEKDCDFVSAAKTLIVDTRDQCESC